MAAVDEPVKPFFDIAIAKVSLNDWQRAWIAYGLRACSVPLTPRSATTRWLLSQLNARPNSLSAAEAAVTLSVANVVSFQTLESFALSVSADFSAWYLQAIANLRDQGRVSKQQIGALRPLSALSHSILK